jgi:hypothetical protein
MPFESRRGKSKGTGTQLDVAQARSLTPILHFHPYRAALHIPSLTQLFYEKGFAWMTAYVEKGRATVHVRAAEGCGRDPVCWFARCMY